MGPDTPLGATISDLPDVRARETEARMTDEERFSLLVSIMGTNTWIRERDPRIPAGCP
jgi:beta-glucosidase